MIRFVVIATIFCILSACCKSGTLNSQVPAPQPPEKEFPGETAFLPKTSANNNSKENKKLRIKLAVNDVYCKDTACECVHYVAARRYIDVLKKLSNEHNIELDLKYFTEPYEMEKALISRQYDGAICKPWLAFMLVPKHGMQYKRIADVLDPENNQWLSGLFMVNKDSPIKTLTDLDGKRLVSGQADAYEKYHAPMNMLRESGINTGKIFDKASCIECIGELLDNNADVAIVSDYVMSASCAVDIAKPEDFRIIARTERIPLTSVILDFSKVSKADGIRLQQALLAVSGDKSPKSMLSNGFVLPSSWKPVSFTKQPEN